MEKVMKILEMAKDGIPQALARFNDGEVGIMFNKGFVAARGDQKGSIELQTALIDAIKHEQKNYWKGLPCQVCMRKQYKLLEEQGWINHEYKYNTCAVVNTNRNWDMFSVNLQKALRGKQVVWVSGGDQKLDQVMFDIVEHITFNRKNTWEKYHIVLRQCLDIVRPHRVFMFSCGPTARILVKNLFQMRSDATFLDLGSTYEPFTRNVWHKCHLDTLKKCSGCN